jgi:hypothetical protein
MKTIQEQLKTLGYRLEDRLKDLCGELTPDKRITALLAMLLILAGGNLYFSVFAIYDWGRNNGRREQLYPEPVSRPELNRGKTQFFFDSNPAMDEPDSIHTKTDESDGRETNME